MNKWASFAHLYHAKRPLCNHEIQHLRLMAVDFGLHFPMHFPTEGVTPKFHKICFHVPAFAERNAQIGISPGMACEQGVESFHRIMAWHAKRNAHNRAEVAAHQL